MCVDEICVAFIMTDPRAGHRLAASGDGYNLAQEPPIARWFPLLLAGVTWICQELRYLPATLHRLACPLLHQCFLCQLR